MKPAACCASVLGLALALTPAPDSARAQLAGREGPARFEPLARELSRARSAMVAVACGTASAPWAYRGTRGDSLELKALKRVEMDERWARDLAQALMVESDWDSAHRFTGITKRCREARDPPHFIVSWRAGAEVYALFSFESRCALVFKAQQPLGTIWFRDRADPLFAAIRGALAADSSIRAMPTPAEVAPTAGSSPQFGSYVWVEELPEVLEGAAPAYPTRAREEGWQGTVEIRALVGEDGAVHDAFVHKSVRGLDDAALACVWDWKFKPAMADGKAIAVWVAIPVKFSLH